MALAALCQDLHAVDLLHAEVGQHHVELLLVEQLERIHAALRAGHVVAFLLHNVLEVAERDPFVVDDQKFSVFGIFPLLFTT